MPDEVGRGKEEGGVLPHGLHLLHKRKEWSGEVGGGPGEWGLSYIPNHIAMEPLFRPVGQQCTTHEPLEVMVCAWK